MSDFVFRGLEDFERAAAKEKVQKDTKTIAVKVILLVLSLLLLLEALAYLFVVPCMGPVKIVWKGLTAYTISDMGQAIAPVSGKNWIQFNCADAQTLIASMPGIEDVQVVKRFPDKVSIKVTERTPVAMTFVSIAGRTTPVQIDRHGILFPMNTFVTQSSQLPLISGIPVENIPEGMRIPGKYVALIKQVAAIREQRQNYFGEVSEIHVVPKEYGNYELVLYPIHSRTRILTDRQLNEEALQYMMVMLDVVNTIKPDVEEIDIRYGSFSYRTRECIEKLGEER